MATAIGRDDELTRARAALEDTSGASILLAGPAGIGKSTVLDSIVDIATAQGFQVRRTRAAAAETDLPFVGVRDLIGDDVRDLRGELPDRLRQALDVVLLHEQPPTGGTAELAVDVAVLEVLQTLASQQRTALVLDDLQWLDPPTRKVLGFALRRLPRQAVTAIAAVRGPSEPDDLLPEPATVLQLDPLTEQEISEVIAAATGRRPGPSRSRTLFALSGGNPLLAVELARHAANIPANVSELPVPDRYRVALSTRLDQLSPDGQATLLAAALLSRPTVELLSRAGTDPGLTETETAGLLRRTTRSVEFTHPLMASVSRDRAAPSVVRAMHRTLSDLATDPAERARHLALGAELPDETIASQLENAAQGAAERAATGTAAALAAEALRLTPEANLTGRVLRACLAAHFYLRSGEPGNGVVLLQPLVESLPPGPLRGRALTAFALAFDEHVAGAMPLVVEALEQPGLEPDVAIEATYLLGDWKCGNGQLTESAEMMLEVLRLGEIAGRDDVAGLAARYRSVLDLFLGTPLAQSPTWQLASASSMDGRSTYEHPDLPRAWEASWADDQAEALRLLDPLVALAEDSGDFLSEGGLMLHRAEFEIRRGDLSGAAAASTRAQRLIADAEQMPSNAYIRAHIMAWNGALADARALSAKGVDLAREQGNALCEGQNLLVLGFTEVSAANPAAAARAFDDLRDLMARMQWGHPGCYRWQGDAVEAYLATRRPDDAMRVAAELWAQSDRMDLDGCRALAARCDGLVHAHQGDLKLAEDSLRRSLDLMERLEMPLERARTLLGLGVVLRRGRQKAVAREVLEDARAIFATAGAAAWMARVDDELERTSWARAGADLTQGEHAVARLAAAGATNKEIGAQLFLSQKTVESVLTRVYRKLAVRSRTDLARIPALTDGAD